MSYAIEVKKRKFERILESLTDSNAPSASRTSLNSRNNSSRTASASIAHQIDGTVDATKRRRITPNSTAISGNVQTKSLSAHYLPSSRGAFLDRLETFRNVTKWHIPSTSAINAAAWAKRGWVCQDTDTVSCPSCREKLLIDLDVKERPATTDEDQKVVEDRKGDDEEDPLDLYNAVYEGLIKRYSEMIVTAHMDGCPWKRRGCDESIQRIEGLLNTKNAIAGLEMRYNSISAGVIEVPKVADLPSSGPYSVKEQELVEFGFADRQDLSADILKLAMCGWQKRDSDVVECRHCFRSLGLWLYRGDDPLMENLDVVDSHLEYCPWRSPEAQDPDATKKQLSPPSPSASKVSMPGWILVYTAIVKDNQRGQKKPSQASTSQASATAETDGTADPNLTPEQREKKMKDLLRRIKELRKPFNVKSLLRKRDKSRVVH